MNKLASLALALLLAACGSSRVYNTDYSTTSTISELAIAAGSAPVPVVVAGNPFAQASIERLNTGVTAAMPTYFASNLQWQSAPPLDPNATNRVVFLFRQEGVARRDEVCGQQPSASPAPMGADLQVTAAFCRGPSALSSASGSVPMPMTPEDPAFKELVANVTTALFPPRTPLDDNRRFPLFFRAGAGFGSGGSFLGTGFGFGF
ncbi:hypothetical protein ACFSM5_07245 [Lacibacterium aquatile]|uniref:Lipoprotein n=1 Tax=Lacibacterium aquatile TaxID=1168082 RepID=A0ABW5DNH4_9PROT